MKRMGLGARTLTAVMTLFGLALPALGEEVTVKNDSIDQGSPTTIVGDFVPGEQAAVRLTSPCNGAIVAVQILWLEGTPGHGFSIERAIHIFEGNSFPTPGAELLELQAPVMTPGGFNEFRYLDEAQTLPINVPVTVGQQFIISLEFENGTHVGNGGPSVVRDGDGCTSGKNALYAIPGGWLNFCLIITGDVAIRAVINCEEADGACCLPDGTCQELTPTVCAAMSGAFQGDFTLCANVDCPSPPGACCFGPDSCLNFTEDDCGTAGGTWLGAGTECDGFACPLGACCLPDGSCVDGIPGADCDAQGGVFQGVGSECGSVECPQPGGACCLSNGNCLVLAEASCNVIPNTSWAGPGTDCEDGNDNGVADACEDPLHPGDLDCDGDVDFDDIDPFVAALSGQATYEAAYPDCEYMNADTNGDGSVDFDDIDAFVGLLAG